MTPNAGSALTRRSFLQFLAMLGVGSEALLRPSDLHAASGGEVSSAPEIRGTWDSKFDLVIETFTRNFTDHGDHGDVGASFAAFIEGESVIDVWAGHKDLARTVPWEQDTIVNVYSSTKTMTFLVILMLYYRGELDLDAPVARYWPEFAANGKEGITVTHAMTYTDGLPGFDHPVAPEVLLDWDAVTTLLAAQKPWWEHRTQSGYHPLTQGYILGEVVQRVTGKSIGTFFRDEVADPLEADFHIGTPPEAQARTSDLFSDKDLYSDKDVTVSATPPDDDVPQLPHEIFQKRVFDSHRWPKDFVNTVGWREAEIPAANGHGNARSIAKIQSVVACGGEAHGVQLLDDKTVKEAFSEKVAGVDLLYGVNMRFGLGYGLPSGAVRLSPSESVGMWGGAGGSMVVVDRSQKLAFSRVMNQMRPEPDMIPFGMATAIYKSLGLS
jgi:CubicO group peptidase (beta-lactamase class C family)